MGEVYRARDTRLDRAVAIKILHENSGSPERRSRFEREARAIAALTHPHICTVHDVGHHEGVDFLVMELLEGETLTARLSKGPLAIAEVLAYAIQIADALDKAHRHGIVHRDLKPANVFLTRSGAKLLDFGLAKLRSESASILDGPTKAAPLTAHGEILGTLAYMSPEQLEGRDVDPRSDIFAFGAVVFEMATGKRAFDGASQASLIGSVLHTVPPPITQVTPAAPPALERLVAVCLSKDPEDRWSTAHDVLLHLKGIPEASQPLAAPVVPRRMRRERLAWAAAAAGIVRRHRARGRPVDWSRSAEGDGWLHSMCCPCSRPTGRRSTMARRRRFHPTAGASPSWRPTPRGGARFTSGAAIHSPRGRCRTPTARRCRSGLPMAAGSPSSRKVSSRRSPSPVARPTRSRERRCPAAARGAATTSFSLPRSPIRRHGVCRPPAETRHPCRSRRRPRRVFRVSDLSPRWPALPVHGGQRAESRGHRFSDPGRLARFGGSHRADAVDGEPPARIGAPPVSARLDAGRAAVRHAHAAALGSSAADCRANGVQSDHEPGSVLRVR